jgi:hypothetical protein
VMTFVDGELGGVPRLVLSVFHQKSIYVCGVGFLEGVLAAPYDMYIRKFI